MNSKVNDILNGQIISKWDFINTLAEELRSKQEKVNAKLLKQFAKDKWQEYPKMRKIYAGSDDLYDALMDKFELPYE